MKTIEDHIQKDKEILADPSTSKPMRHHIEDELHDLEEYVDHTKQRSKQAIITTQMFWNYFVICTQTNQNV